MRLAVELAVTLLSARAYGSCFPPAPHPALAWVSLVPLLVVLRGAGARRGAFLAWAWTVAMAYTVNDWFPRAVSGYFEQHAAVGIGLFLGVSTLTAGIQYMAFAEIYRRQRFLPGAVAPFAAAAAWVAADMARLLLFGGDPWAILGYAQIGVLPLMQIADTAGVHGITFVVVAVNAALAEAWCALRAGRRLAPAAAGLGLAAASVAAVAAYGSLRIGAADRGATGEGVPVGVVQAHLPLGAQWKRSFYGRNLATYLELTRDLLRTGAARLVVWPENAMTFFVADEPLYREAIASVLAPAGAELLAGGPAALHAPRSGYLNSAFLLSTKGDVRGRYDKRLLLPFAEYFPFGRFDFLRRAFERVRVFTPGDRTPLLDTAAGLAGVVICNEGFFPEPAAERVRDGARLLVNLANDSWLSDPKYSEPAFDMVRLRAVEQRRWIVRASTAGPSALIDPIGRVVQRTDLFSAATLAGTIEPRSDVTPYARLGDTFAWACVAAALASAWAGARRERRRAVPGEALNARERPAA